MKKQLRSVNMLAIIIFFSIYLSSCVVRPARPMPPAVRVEVVPRAPSPRHHWVAGHYVWHRNHYVWNGGKYRRY